MNGQKSILAARAAQYKPNPIFFDIDQRIPKNRTYHEEPENFLRTRQHATVELSMTEPWKKFDFRFVKGCRCHLCGVRWDDGIVEFSERLVEVGAEMVITCCAPHSAEILIFFEGEWRAS